MGADNEVEARSQGIPRFYRPNEITGKCATFVATPKSPSGKFPKSPSPYDPRQNLSRRTHPASSHPGAGYAIAMSRRRDDVRHPMLRARDNCPQASAPLKLREADAYDERLRPAAPWSYACAVEHQHWADRDAGLEMTIAANIAAPTPIRQLLPLQQRISSTSYWSIERCTHLCNPSRHTSRWRGRWSAAMRYSSTSQSCSRESR